MVIIAVGRSVEMRDKKEIRERESWQLSQRQHHSNQIKSNDKRGNVVFNGARAWIQYSWVGRGTACGSADGPSRGICRGVLDGRIM